jgi:hypothetical protein
MKHLFIFFLISVCLACISNHGFAQDPREAQIRRLENLEREAVLKSDSLALYGKLWSPTMVIHTPANVVGTIEGTKAQLRSGNLSYLSFERDIEKVTFKGNVAIVMGGEKIKPQGKQLNAGKLVTRRFTHVWMNSNNTWSIIARQATIIKVE